MKAALNIWRIYAMSLRALFLFCLFLLPTLSSHAALAPSGLSSDALIAQTSGKADAGSAKKPKKEKKAKGKKGGGVTFFDGSAENRSERDKRLMRECKGRPNAGACEGYSRP
jgi:hypothetical protein